MADFQKRLVGSLKGLTENFKVATGETTHIMKGEGEKRGERGEMGKGVVSISPVVQVTSIMISISHQAAADEMKHIVQHHNFTELFRYTKKFVKLMTKLL